MANKFTSIISQALYMKFKNYYHQVYLEWRKAELFSSIFSIFGIISACAGYEANFSPNRSHNNCAEGSKPIYGIITLILSMISMFFLILRHKLKSIWRNQKSEDFEYFKTQKKSFFSNRLIIELLIISIFPYPYITGELRYWQSNDKESSEYYNNKTEVCYTISEILYAAMYIRFIYLIRALFNFTPFQDNHARYYCSQFQTKANIRFSIRCMIKISPLLVIYGISSFSFIILGILLRVFERPYSDVSGLNFESIQNSIWNTAITMSTIGYGDLFPTTVVGRIIGVICALWGAFVFSMIVFTFYSILELDKQQKLAFSSIKQTRAAARVVIASLKFQVTKKKFGLSSVETTKVKKLLDQRLQKFVSTIKKLLTVDTGLEDLAEANQFRGLSKQILLLDKNIDSLSRLK